MREIGFSEIKGVSLDILKDVAHFCDTHDIRLLSYIMTIIQDIKYILLKPMIVIPIQWQRYSIKKQLWLIIHCGVILIKPVYL